MRNIVKQLKPFAVVLLAFVLMAGLVFVASAEEADVNSGTAIDLSDITWVVKGTETPADSLTYNGEPIIIEPANLPSGVELENVTGNNAKYAGDYSAKATLTYTKDGQTVTETLTYNWSIAKAVYDMSKVSFKDGVFVYNGEAQNLAIEGELPTGVRVSYGDGYVDAGTYTITATFKGDARNYEVIPDMTATMTINKAVYDMTGIKFNDKTLSYRGIAQSLEIEGTLPKGVRVFYDGSFTNVGVYTVTAMFVGDANNYEAIPSMSATMKIVAATPDDCFYVYKDDAGRVIVEVLAADGIPADKLNVTDNSYLYNNFEISKFYSIKVLASYDVSFSFKGELHSVDEDLIVSILIPENLRQNDKLQLVHITESGEIIGVDAERVGDRLVFETDHFSTYAMVEGYETLPAPQSIITWWMILLFVLAALVIIFFIISLCLKAKPENPAEPDGDPSSDEQGDAEAVKSKPASDATEEEKSEPVPAEDSQPRVDKEEPGAEEPQDVEDEENEEPEEELNEASSAPLELSSDADGEENVGSTVIDGQVVMVRYRSSFVSRLIQAESDIQDYYTVIKNTLLSYKGVKARTSWNYESFNKGRFQAAKLNIKGRTLSLYLALSPEEYNASKYHFIDVSGKGKFDKVPMMLKIRSDRALKYAVELIEELMKTNGIEAGPTQNVDYRMPYETTEALAEKDLVKIILPAGVTIGENDSLVRLDVSDVIEGSSSED